ncbi:hypothetical protein [Aeromonas phage Akh-2]|nr:hypothetical protein [Aeromonas phage Akh-2]
MRCGEGRGVCGNFAVFSRFAARIGGRVGENYRVGPLTPRRFAAFQLNMLITGNILYRLE